MEIECNLSKGALSETHMVGWREGRGRAGNEERREDIDIHGISIARGTDILHAGKVRAVPTDTDD